MAKGRIGLQKEVSTIFTGVQVPKSDDKHQVHDTKPAPAQYVPPKPISPSPPTVTGPQPQQPHQPAPAPQPPPSPPRMAPVPKRIKIGTARTALSEIPFLKTWQRIKDKLLAPKPGVDPKRQKAMIILAPALLVILIVVFSRVLWTPSGQLSNANTFMPSGAAASSEVEINWEIPPLYPTAFRDPMQFYTVRSAKQSEFGTIVVKAIVHSEDKPSAVINEEVVFEGDEVMGATITKINPDSVEFEMNDKKWTQEVER